MTRANPHISMIAVVIFMITGGYLGVDIHLASMPTIQLYMHTDPQHMQQSVSFFLMGMGGSLLLYGPLSDRFGRRPVVIVGLCLASLSAFASVYTDHIAEFLLMRVLQGVGSAVCAGLGRTILADSIHGKRLSATLSYAGLTVCLSPLLAPMLGGYLEHWFTWRANFLALGCYMLVALMLFVLFVPESNKHRNKHALSVRVLVDSYQALLRNRVFVGACILSGIGLAATMTYAATSSFILQRHYHVSPVVYGWLTSLVSIGSVLGRLVAARIVHRWGCEKSIRIAQFLFTVAGMWLLAMVFMHLQSIVTLLLATLVVTFAQALAQGNCASMALASFHDKRGAAGAVFGSCQTLVAFFYSALAAAIVHSIGMLGFVYLLIGLCGVMVYYQFLTPKPVRA